MISGFGWAALALLFGYLALFFCGSALAAQAAGRPIWLFAPARGRDRLAAACFRAAFVLAFFGSLLWPALPGLHKVDPLWTEGSAVVPGLIGVFVAGLGAMFAFAAQMSMGTSWRGGVAGGAAGNAVDRARHGAVTDFVDLYRGDRRRCDAGSGMVMIGPCPASSPPQAGLP